MTSYSTMSVEELAQYIKRHRAVVVIGVVNIAARHDEVRGKVNLGLAAVGRNMTNEKLARPVETARKMGLLSERRDGAALCYSITDRGRALLAALKAVA